MVDPNRAFLLSRIRQPAKHGLDYVRAPDWSRRIFSFASAQRHADSAAKRSAITHAVGLVSDQAGYWRINVAGQPEA